MEFTQVYSRGKLRWYPGPPDAGRTPKWRIDQYRDKRPDPRLTRNRSSAYTIYSRKQFPLRGLSSYIRRYRLLPRQDSYTADTAGVLRGSEGVQY